MLKDIVFGDDGRLVQTSKVEAADAKTGDGQLAEYVIIVLLSLCSLEL